MFSPAIQHNTSSSLLKNYSRYNVSFVSGEGAYLYDTSGYKYLDFLSGIAVNGFGHRNPAILTAVREQLEKVWHTSNLFLVPGQEILASSLANRTSLDSVFFCNSGTEANEAAIKFVRSWGKGRSTIITAINGFHGRTMGSLSASAQYKLWEGFFPLTPGFVYVPFNDIEAVENSLTADTAAVMVEPIQGESGIILPSYDYLKELRELCSRHNLLMVVDEVQTGMGRTGKLFSYQWEEILPDIITAAKGIANGLPLGAVICSEETAKTITPGSHGSTFGGNPVAVAAANTVMELLTEDQLAYNYRIGERLQSLIRNLNLAAVQEVRGKGLMIGIELKKGYSAKKAVKKLLSELVITGNSGDSVIRILPPFIITEDEINKFLVKLSVVINNLEEENDF